MLFHRNKTFKASLLAMALGTALLLSGCSLLPAEEETLLPPLVKPPQESYRTVEVKRGDIAKEIKGSATLESYSSEAAKFTAEGGRVKEVMVKQGDQVKTGDVLIQLDVGDMDINVKQHELNMVKSRAALKSAKLSEDADNIAIAQLQYEIDRIKYERLLEAYNSKQLLAGIDGQVTYLAEMEEGQGVAPHETLVILSDPSKLRVAFQGSTSADVNMVSVGQRVELEFRDNTVVEGKVTQTPASAPFSDDPVIKERNSKMIFIDAELPESAEIGGSVNIRILLQESRDTLVIPRSGLRTYLGRNFVRVLEEGDNIREVDVEAGISGSTEVEITAGLEEGMLVVLP
ncbi:efflux RND transporter periplasmic adaptor subunit [Paenibacillus sp. CAU 1782]